MDEIKIDELTPRDIRDGDYITVYNDNDIDAGIVPADAYIKRQSEETQVLESDLSLGHKSQLLVHRTSTGVDYAAVFLGEYGTYTQEEHASTNEPTCFNHGAVAPDGTVVGINPIANYKDENGVPGADFYAYLSNIPPKNNRYYADISTTGRGLSYSFGSVTLLLYRLDSNTLEIRVASTETLTLPLSHSYRGNNTLETLRETFIVGPTSTTIGTIGVGQFVLAEFWTRIDDKSYDIVAGSDDTDLTRAWIEVKISDVSTQSSARSLIAEFKEETHSERKALAKALLDKKLTSQNK